MPRLPLIAIIGRPNVGKSTLFNRLTGARQAIIHEKAGMTRDRNYGMADWRTRIFRIVDTGGWEAEDLETSAVSSQMREQAAIAIDEADFTILLTDVRDPDNPVDRDVLELLRRRQKPFVLAVNRCDNPKIEMDSNAFYSHGVDQIYPISALHGLGTGDLLDAVIDALPMESRVGDHEEEKAVRVAVVGRPNVGKSTLINQILGESRLIASPMAGTTRDSIDTPFRRDEKDYVLVDTAGIRRRGAIQKGIEKLCAMASMLAMERSDVALLLIDGTEGLTDQDKHIAGYAAEAGCGLIIVYNKWDAVEKDHTTSGVLAKKIRQELGFAAYAPIIFVSALTGQRVVKIFELIDQVAVQHGRRIGTSELNKMLERVLLRKSPAVRKNRPLKIKYISQVGSRPPHFAIFCNDSGLMHFSYKRYLINQIRFEYGFEGVPIRISLRSTKREAPKGD